MSLQICKKCLMLSTRPRMKFNSSGVCSACEWAEEKRTVVDWAARKKELDELCKKYRRIDGTFDCVVPVSGGKDSSMVAHKLKHEYNMHPLCVNVNHSPVVNTPLNDINLHNFINNGFDCIRLYPNPKIMQKLDKNGLVEFGQPYFGWMTAMVLAPIKVAIKFGIPFIVYGEEGEVEYGGSTELKNSALYTIDHIKRLYLSGINLNEISGGGVSADELWWWSAPTEEDIDKIQPAIAHWSYFENWSSENNYRYAKKHLGLKSADKASVGTYTNFSQTDSILYPLHTYFMYLKFGFGRCSQDVCIDIRTGNLSRERGIELVKKYDETYPKEYEAQYLDYYQMTKEEFERVIDKWANKELLEKRNGMWRKKFSDIYK